MDGRCLTKPKRKETHTLKNKLQAVNAIEALANFAECDPSDIEQEKHDHYGMEVFSIGRKEYAVGTDEEAYSACIESIKNTAWAFRPSFICEYCEIPFELEEALESMQTKQCESCNDAILSLINKASGGIAGFTEAAISADGRGHFLSSYDGEENEESGFFIYRIN